MPALKPTTVRERTQNRTEHPTAVHESEKLLAASAHTTIPCALELFPSFCCWRGWLFFVSFCVSPTATILAYTSALLSNYNCFILALLDYKGRSFQNTHTHTHTHTRVQLHWWYTMDCCSGAPSCETKSAERVSLHLH